MERSLLRDMFSLWFPKGVEADFTYGKGIMWKHLTEEKKPSKRFDIEPQDETTTWADIGKRIPLENNSVKSGMFDPPFLATSSNSIGLMRKRFSAFHDVEELWTFHKNALGEIHRVLEPGGRVVVKIQDVTTHVSRFSSNEMYNFAIHAGFRPLDKFQLSRRSGLPLAPNIKVQRVARKTLVDYYIFEKPKRKYKHPIVSVLSRN